MKIKKAYDYDDLLIVPKLSEINSRNDVNVFDSFGNLPIFSSPMKGISGYELVKRMGELGGLGILHRFFASQSIRMLSISDLGRLGIPFGVAVGLGSLETEIVKYSIANGCRLICIDVANGYLSRVGEFVNWISENYDIPIMAGNVVTKEGVDFLFNKGARYVRVGIGNGTLCTTRNVTGIGYPQLSALMDCVKAECSDDVFLVSDGGIKNPGNAVKSFACGADYIMLGTILATTFESEHVEPTISGMASRKHQEEMGKEIISVEGITQSAEKVISLEDLINEFIGGIKSACTYLNADDYRGIYTNAEFVRTGNGSIKRL